jgi:hypothetical protein
MKETNKKQNSPYSTTILFLKEKQYELINIGISSKTAFDWRGNGIYLEENKTKYRMKYSAIEYIWLLLVKELREFGLPLKSILKLKEFLLFPINVEQLLLDVQNITDVDNELIQELGQEIGIFKGSKTELKKALSEVGQNIVDSMFMSMIISVLLNQENYLLFIKKDGSCFIEEIKGTEFSTNSNNGNTVSGSCIRISLNDILLIFLRNEKINTFQLTNEDEQIRVTEEFDFKIKEGKNKIRPELNTAIEKLMRDGNFREIIYTTADGEKVNVRKSTSK